MGADFSLDRSELACLSAVGIADLASACDPGMAEYRQTFIDFGIDGDMLVRLPRDQLADALHRTGVDRDRLEFLLEELEKVRQDGAGQPKSVEIHRLWDQVVLPRRFFCHDGYIIRRTRVLPARLATTSILIVWRDTF